MSKLAPRRSASLLKSRSSTALSCLPLRVLKCLRTVLQCKLVQLVVPQWSHHARRLSRSLVHHLRASITTLHSFNLNRRLRPKTKDDEARAPLSIFRPPSKTLPEVQFRDRRVQTANSQLSSFLVKRANSVPETQGRHLKNSMHNTPVILLPPGHPHRCKVIPLLSTHGTKISQKIMMMTPGQLRWTIWKCWTLTLKLTRSSPRRRKIRAPCQCQSGKRSRVPCDRHQQVSTPRRKYPAVKPCRTISRQRRSQSRIRRLLVRVGGHTALERTCSRRS